MGKFVKSENVYIRAKILDIDAEESRRYLVQTDLAKFYVTEMGDDIKSNPGEIYTAHEFYAMCITIAKMSTQDLQLCFGTQYRTVGDVLTAGMEINELREKFITWQYDNLIDVGDMVYATIDGLAESPLLCVVIGISEGNVAETATDNTYSVYSDETESIYLLDRTKLVSARKKAVKVTQSLKDLKEATKEAREAIG